MLVFKGETVEGRAKALWPAIYRACEKYHRFIIDVRKYDESAEISLQQMKYWHSVPIKLYAEYTGNSQWQSEQWLKRECGKQWFMQEARPEEARRGQIMWECQHAICKHLCLIPAINAGHMLLCPVCKRSKIDQFFMLSKTELKVNDFTQVLQNTWDFMENINCHCPPPDPNWRINKKKKERVA